MRRKLWDQTLNIATLDGDRKIESNHASSTIKQGHCKKKKKKNKDLVLLLKIFAPYYNVNLQKLYCFNDVMNC